MSGLRVSYDGSVTRPASILTEDGRPYLHFVTVADGVRRDGEDAVRIQVALFDSVDELAPQIVKYAEVHVEGRLLLWELNGGRTGLAVVASRVDVYGQRGRVVGEIGRANRGPGERKTRPRD